MKNDMFDRYWSERWPHSTANPKTLSLSANYRETRAAFNSGMQAALKELQPLIAASVKTINENLHLCDGDVCTLKDLRDAVCNLPDHLKG